jgi:hypothetical protein
MLPFLREDWSTANPPKPFTRFSQKAGGLSYGRGSWRKS